MDKKRIKSVTIYFENCEAITIDVDESQAIEVNYLRSFQHDTLIVVFNHNSPRRFLQRIKERKDIVSIGIQYKPKHTTHYTYKDELFIDVPYDEDRYGFNKLQQVAEDNKGNLIIKWINFRKDDEL